MDDIRNWILIIGSLLFAAVVGHAVWLSWRNRRSRLRLHIDRDVALGDVDELDLLRAELPTGGARVVAPGESEHASAQPAELDLDQQVPVLMDPVAEAREGASAPAEPAPSARRAPEQVTMNAAMEDAAADAAAIVDPQWGEFDEVVVVNVLARDAEFTGTDLLELVRKHGLKFGDMNIFHRYTPGKRTLDGIRFSMASALEPGTFDLGVLEEYTTAGVSFFMRLPGPEEPMAAFEEMLRVAKDLAERLDGELRDEQRSVMTSQTIEHCRQRIREFTRKRLMRRA